MFAGASFGKANTSCGAVHSAGLANSMPAFAEASSGTALPQGRLKIAMNFANYVYVNGQCWISCWQTCLAALGGGHLQPELLQRLPS